MYEPQKKYNTRSRVADPSSNAPPVFSTFPDQAARERANLTSTINAPRVESAAFSSRTKTATNGKQVADKVKASKIRKTASSGGGSNRSGRQDGNAWLRELFTGGNQPNSTPSQPNGVESGRQEAKTEVATEGPKEPDSPLGPCAVATIGLINFRHRSTLRRAGNRAVEDPAVYDEGLETNMIFRALATVTEAISDLNRGVQFSLLDPASVRALQTQEDAYSCARPGNELLIPITDGDHNRMHTTLYTVGRRAAGDTFDLKNFDSANGNFQRLRRTAAGNKVRRVLTNSSWSRGTNAVVSGAAPSNGNDTRQRLTWECGIHVVLYGWAYALGLRLATRPLPYGENGAKYMEFLRQAVEMINLALRGFMDSETIRSFLECHEFILPGQTVPLARTFERTFPLEKNEDYEMRLVMVNTR